MQSLINLLGIGKWLKYTGSCTLYMNQYISTTYQVEDIYTVFFYKHIDFWSLGYMFLKNVLNSNGPECMCPTMCLIQMAIDESYQKWLDTQVLAF